jgi:hypothetical protein
MKMAMEDLFLVQTQGVLLVVACGKIENQRISATEKLLLARLLMCSLQFFTS